MEKTSNMVKWARCGQWLVACVPMWIGLLWAFDTYWGEDGMAKRARLLEDEMILVRSNAQLAEQVNALTYRVQGLQQRVQVQQQVVRDVLGWVQDNDMIIDMDGM